MGECGRQARRYLHPHPWVKPDTLFSSLHLSVPVLLPPGKPCIPSIRLPRMMDVRREEWARPGGRGVVSGLNSILYQTHLYLHKPEACLLGRESTAIHFLSGLLADGGKTWTATALGMLGDSGSDKYAVRLRQLCSTRRQVYPYCPLNEQQNEDVNGLLAFSTSYWLSSEREDLI